MTQLLIIDALNLIRRIHAVQSGQSLSPAQALVATRTYLVNTTRKLLEQGAPSHAIAVFDAEQPGWRKARLPTYKEGRSPMPIELREGLESLQDAFWELSVDSLLSQTDEADDLIATLACKVARRGQPVTIVSTDKGFCQLLCPFIAIRDYFNRRWLDLPFVQAQFGVRPDQLVDYWALTGVAGSGIKGVPGIGPKSAAKLLQTHGSLSAILAAGGEDRSVQKVQTHGDEARLAQELVRLRDDIELGFNLRDLRLPAAK